MGDSDEKILLQYTVGNRDINYFQSLVTLLFLINETDNILPNASLLVSFNKNINKGVLTPYRNNNLNVPDNIGLFINGDKQTSADVSKHLDQLFILIRDAKLETLPKNTFIEIMAS